MRSTSRLNLADHAVRRLAECSRKLTLHTRGSTSRRSTLGVGTASIGPVPTVLTSRVEGVSGSVAEPLKVWIDQDLCTGDGLCVQYAPEVFEFDVDGLAYVKDSSDELLRTACERCVLALNLPTFP